MKRERLAILGASGSIGANALDVVSRHPQRFDEVASLIAEQGLRFARRSAAKAPRCTWKPVTSSANCSLTT